MPTIVANQSARLERAGAGSETIRAGGGSDFYPQYTPTRPRVQVILSRPTMRLAVFLAGVADSLAGAALRWECSQ